MDGWMDGWMRRKERKERKRFLLRLKSSAAAAAEINE